MKIYRVELRTQCRADVFIKAKNEDDAEDRLDELLNSRCDDYEIFIEEDLDDKYEPWMDRRKALDLAHRRLLEVSPEDLTDLMARFWNSAWDDGYEMGKEDGYEERDEELRQE